MAAYRTQSCLRILTFSPSALHSFGLRFSTELLVFNGTTLKFARASRTIRESRLIFLERKGFQILGSKRVGGGAETKRRGEGGHRRHSGSRLGGMESVTLFLLGKGKSESARARLLRQLLPFPLGFWDPCSCVSLLSWKQQL